MSKLNPIEEFEFIEDNFRSYLKSTFKFNEKEYQTMFEDELNGVELYKGPYINATLPFKTGNTLNELIDKGIVSKEFKKLNNVKLDQKLYLHQQKSLEKISSGKNVVITTGTGSGKTECFLYPIINSLLQEAEEGTLNDGIRAIFLYPMNALVNDQIDRVRKILSDYPDITYGFFTGDTPPKRNIEEYRRELEILNDTKIPENELLTREQIRNNIPNLLFTNYSMLEYLLIRPTDYVLFNNEKLKNWRYVVLDEAHTYNGALGIEVSLLLRRLTGMADKKPQFILTSATLGEQGKNEDDIVNFAQSLTSVEYNKNDIIFSTRISLNEKNIQYKIEPKDYIFIDSNLDNIEYIKNLSKKYNNSIDSDDINKILYDLLLHDQNIYILYNLLGGKEKNFKNIWSKIIDYGFNKKEELISLIHLINVARDNFKVLYDMKYHSFIRTLSGAFVTLGENKKLKISPSTYIDNKIAFELGNCRYCNTAYILGKITSDNILRQNSNVDIYENYDENADVKVDYFLIKHLVNQDEIDIDMCKEYEICSKCGKIHDISELNFQDCECGNQYKVELLKIETDSVVKNNINECPCCKRKSNTGIVRTLNLGKDEATAVIGQILYKAIDNNEEVEAEDTSNTMLSFSVLDKPKIKKIREQKKQYIAFSDSRQQASFFAEFFEYNFKRFLRNRLLWYALEKSNHQPISVNHLIMELKNVVEAKKLFPDDNLDSEKEAWITVLRELLEVDGQYTGEGIGLFYFKLDIDNLLDKFPAGAIESEFGKYHLNNDNFVDFISVIFNVMRTTPAINYDKSALSVEERMNYLEYRGFENFVKLKKGKESKEGNVRSFLPVNNRANDIVDYTMRVCKCSQEEAISILEKIYHVIGKNVVFQKSDKFADEVYQIDSSKYSLHSYKNSQYYQCTKCKGLTIYNVNDVCPKRECDGTLEKCDPDKVMADNYYRNEYITKKIEAMVIKEHTAQLTRKMAKEYQQNFKNGLINILSCSTTFEMGVDIGSLETVFMRNVPPSPANYVQRAGRAGRSKDSSAFILTFCNNSSHDYTYFENPIKMIDGIINPPYFSITNEKIIIRHLIAASFGYFFRKHVDYFENVGKLVYEGGIEKFKEYISSKPEDLNNYINNKILDSNIYNKYANFKWFEIMQTNLNVIDDFINSINSLVNDFSSGIEEAKNSENFTLAEYFKNQIEKIKYEKVIDDLSKYGVIPKYGFPVDVVNLQIYENGRLNNNYDLSRDLSIAISEYAPESEIIVNKVKYTSRYITLPKKGDLRRYYYYTCQYCGRTNVTDVPKSNEKCKYCLNENEISTFKYFIEPIYGFKTGDNKMDGRKKPKKTYAGEKIYLGNHDLIEYAYDFNDLVKIESSTNDQLLVVNENPFFTCNACGYTKINRENPMANIIRKEHYRCNGYRCNNNDLSKIALGHMFKTDVVRIRIKDFYDKKIALSSLYSLLEGISTALDIERRDIDGLLVPDEEKNLNMIIFDNVPGGAGHVKRLKDTNTLTLALKAAIEKVNQHCCEENTSCYNCLRNYYNQKYHKYLSRLEAQKGIKYILENERYQDLLLNSK